ncbi:MAG: protein-tyrosine-phosphatase [Balneolales bacterium]|nr:protein-tyrosine-phosphatase [Balneolales bacterium]
MEITSEVQKFINDSAAAHYPKGDRKQLLDDAAVRLQQHMQDPEKPALVFVCTHNSRRSQFAQVWAAVLQYSVLGQQFFDVHSAGTEVTACNPRTVHALNSIGMAVATTDHSAANPVYMCQFINTPTDNSGLKLWSKTIQDKSMPDSVIAFMTCSDADENCPFVPGAIDRIRLTYTDPKSKDDTPEEQESYLKCAAIICGELNYLFGKLR